MVSCYMNVSISGFGQMCQGSSADAHDGPSAKPDLLKGWTG